MRAAVLFRTKWRSPGRLLLHLIYERLRKRRVERASTLGSGHQDDGECREAVVLGRVPRLYSEVTPTRKHVGNLDRFGPSADNIIRRRKPSFSRDHQRDGAGTRNVR